MVWQRPAVTAFTILALASGGLFPVHAGEKQPPGKGSDRLDAFARTLKLSDTQKQQVKKIVADFDKKATPLLEQLFAERDRGWQALQKALSEEQRAKLKEALKEHGAMELDSIARKLKLTGKQKEQVEKIRGDFWKKFLTLYSQKGEKLAREYRELHLDTVRAGREVLTPEQCTKLHAIQKQDLDEWHDHIFRDDHLKELGKKLGLSAAEFKKLQEGCATHEKKLEQPMTQFKQLCREGSAALGKVLTAEQRAKVHELFPFGYLEIE